MTAHDGWAIKGPDGLIRPKTYIHFHKGREDNWHSDLPHDEYDAIEARQDGEAFREMYPFNAHARRRAAAESLGYSLVKVRLVEVAEDCQ